MEDIETLGSGGALGHLGYMRCVVQHALQAALGAQKCSGQKLAEALEVSGSVASLCGATTPRSSYFERFHFNDFLSVGLVTLWLFLELCSRAVVGKLAARSPKMAHLQ